MYASEPWVNNSTQRFLKLSMSFLKDAGFYLLNESYVSLSRVTYLVRRHAVHSVFHLRFLLTNVDRLGIDESHVTSVHVAFYHSI